MTAIIIELIICHTCHKKLNTNVPYTTWEGSNYCDDCFDRYMELIDPSIWEPSQIQFQEGQDKTHAGVKSNKNTCNQQRMKITKKDVAIKI